jgi:predicted RNase H-like nuclease
MNDMTMVSGIDGCAGGWLCLSRDIVSGRVGATILPHFGQILSMNPEPTVVAVDTPIGLPDRGARQCDLEARKRLGSRRSSVFPAPVRSTLIAMSYQQACDIGRATDGRALSKQTYAILPKIREVDEFLCEDPGRREWIREVHPEVSFWAWNGSKPMDYPKKKRTGELPLGRKEREELVIPRYKEWYTLVQSKLPPEACAYDDLLDAFAALWSAERVLSGEAVLIPDKTEIDSCGLRMEITA